MKGLLELFPFALFVSRELKVLSWGELLPRVMPGILKRGVDLQSVLELERPWFDQISRESLVESRRQGQVWRVREGELKFRGQTMELRKDRLFLPLAPSFRSLDEIESYGLALTDLALLDNSLELLMQTQLQQVAIADSTRLRGVLQTRNSELIRQRRELETAQEIAQLGSFEGPAEGPYKVSRNLSKILGLPAQEFMTKEQLLSAYPSDSTRHLSHEWKTGGSLDVEFDGAYHRWTLCHSGDKMTGTIQDISLQKRGENQLLQAKLAAENANKAQSDFLAMMSHEIRTPMNGVLGLTELLLARTGEAEQLEMLELIRSSGQSLLVILNDILDYSRIESGQMPVESCRLELRPHLRKTGQLFSHQAEVKKIGLEIRVDPRVPEWVMTDPTRLQQILSNLLGNALKFTHSGTVECLVDYQEGRLEVSVRDSGIGIPPDRLAQLFKPFVQAEASTTRRYGGTGLGLSICQKLCRLLGGDIVAESIYGKGSCFRFWLQAQAVSIASVEAQASAAPEMNFAPDLRILVAEDNLVNRRVLLGMLGRLGLQATVVENGLLGLSACQNGAFDLMILDVEMPEMDGLELIRRVRAGEAGTPNREAYIVSLTAQARELDQQGCLEAGANGFLSKPVSLVQLQEALRPVATSARS